MKKKLIAAGTIAGMLLVLYFGGVFFFQEHFLINTTIDGKDFSGKTISDVKSYLTKEMDDYELVITDIKGRIDTIKGKKIGLSFSGNKALRQLLARQNAFAWPLSILRPDSIYPQIEVSYDKQALTLEIANLKAVKVDQTPTMSAHPVYDGDMYVIEPESIGTQLNMNILKAKIREAILNFKSDLDLNEEGCYLSPKYDQNSVEVQKACDEMNRYVAASITYPMTQDVVVDRSVISNWLHCDDDMNVTIDEAAIKAWLSDFGDRFDTVGTTRTIVTPDGEEKEVSGGTYGWSINEIDEFPILLENIRNSETVKREPLYYQKAAVHSAQDWGTTYAEVDLTKQHMWFIKDGNVLMESDVITGLPIPKKETKPGVFDILEMKKDKVLVGEIIPETREPEYMTKVSYWMRVTWTGIGFHDAVWQPGFGGDLYTYLGSHGCINMPYEKAEELYGMVALGTPVVIHK